MPGRKSRETEPVEFHPIASMFPLLEGEELDAWPKTSASTGSDSLHGPSRARFWMAATGPRPAGWRGSRSRRANSKAIARRRSFAWSMNGPRRHLSAGQLAAAAVAMLPELGKAAKERQKAAGGEKKTPRGIACCKNAASDWERSRNHLGSDDGRGVSERQVYAVKSIQERDPILFAEIQKGRKDNHRDPAGRPHHGVRRAFGWPRADRDHQVLVVPVVAVVPIVITRSSTCRPWWPWCRA